jgi:hypothetical protein
MLLGSTLAYSQDAKKPDRAQLEKEFQEKLTGATLVGHFSVVGRTDDKPADPERYELTRVKKLEGDDYLFQARIKYGRFDVTVPLKLKVYWADDTPMISLTNIAIPGLGSEFTSRVLFYGDRYAGTWQHGKVGGHMWGTIERTEKENGKQPGESK